MSISSRLYNLCIFKNFNYLNKINNFHKNIGSKSRFANYIRKNALGHNLTFTNYTYSPHNPIIGTDRAMQWVCENYQAAFDYLDKKKNK